MFATHVTCVTEYDSAQSYAFSVGADAESLPLSRRAYGLSSVSFSNWAKTTSLPIA